ncbi:hypothetical protein [Yinghuangia sp. YIM S09857]|uniref:hypothetical protein n=1 Tax=Yinghuangia sp. YIM S09857 TaxID=3436929 RepID=UPI003F531987
MFEYEMFQAREQELHRAAAHDRQVRRALRSRREARRQAAAVAEHGAKTAFPAAGRAA